MILKNLREIIILWFFISSASAFANALQEKSPAPSEKPLIKIGMSAALSGPSQVLGQEVKRGIETYFSKVNALGGVDGRKLVLVALDDQYEPTLTATNMHQLTDDSQILAIIGNVGTPNAMVSIPIVNEKHILLFGAYTGAKVLRKVPPDRYVINFRASYEDETKAMIKGLLAAGFKPQEVGFFVQNDSYGDSGYQGAMKALKMAGYANPEKLTVSRYPRNTLNVEEGVAQFMNAPTPPKAILIVGTYAPSAKFIKLAKSAFPDTVFLNVSFVGSSALMRELGPEGENVIVMQVVPPLNSDLPAVQEYRSDLNQYSKGSMPDFGSLEGYLDAKLLVMVLNKAAAENKLDREGIVQTFEEMNKVDMGIGVKIGFNKNDHDGLSEVWPTIISAGKYVPLDWLKLQHK